MDQLAELPEDGNRYELLDGALVVTPAPSFLHQRASRELVRILLPYLDGSGLELFYAPTAVREGATTELEPDSLVHSTRSHAAARVVEGPGQLVLAVEITSPSTAHIDRYRKRALYQRHGVPDYWIAFPASRFLERWRPADTEPLILGATVTWQPVAERAPVVVDLVQYLEAVHRA